MEDALASASNSPYWLDQEHEVVDMSYKANSNLQKLPTSLEEKIIPIGAWTKSSGMTQLLVQATIGMVLNKPNGSPFNIEGVLTRKAKLKPIIDIIALASVTSGLDIVVSSLPSSGSVVL
jgi:hypothetical protein